MRNLSKFFLILIIVLAFFLRVYRLDSVPPSLSWDEAAAGYNAFTIADSGKDEWGNSFPLVFKSFGDDKHPVWIYFTAISVKLLGQSEFTTRLPTAIFGVLNVTLLFFLAKTLFNNELVGIFSALFLAVSPYGLQFSRGEWEGNYALFFMMLGLLCFYQALNKFRSKEGRVFLIVSFFSFGLDLLTYHSAKVVIPPIILLLMVLYFKKLKIFGKSFYIALAVLIFFIGLIINDPRLTGKERVSQSKLSSSVIQQTNLYKQTGNYYLAYAEVVSSQYLAHFQNPFLFVSGDKNPKLSIQGVGEFYWMDLTLILIGLVALVYLRSKVTLVILAWLLLAPIPASLVAEAPHAHRALFLMGSMHLLSGLGAYSGINRVKKNFQIFAVFVIFITLMISVKNYLDYYYNVYQYRYAVEWQYGMKQVVEYTKKHPEYNQIYVTNVRSQPYIYFLYYLKVPVQEFQDSVNYETSDTKGFSLVSSFGNYHFNDWDPIDCKAEEGVLCAVTESQYGGLKNKPLLKVKEVIHYPRSETVAYYLVSVK